MTEQEIPMEEEIKESAKTVTDRVSVAGSDLIQTVQALLREAAVRKITVQDKNGRTLVEFPLYAGIIGALFVGSWTVLALIAAWFAEVSILIERDATADDQPSVVGEAVDRTAGNVSTAAHSAKSSVGAMVGSAAHAASGLAKRAADSLESRMAAGEKSAEAIIEAASAAAEPRQCAAITKSGTRCKRNALAGSDYCSTHQPK
jgi:hypothetical protein